MHRVRSTAWAGSVAAALLLTAGCASATTPVAAPPAPLPPAAPSSTATTGCLRATPEPTYTIGGKVLAPLPDEIRCLPRVSSGSLRWSAPGASTPPDLPESMRKAQAGGQLGVDTTEGTSADQALALCQQLTRMGYGPGGSQQITTLVVAFGPRSGYTSVPDRPACFRTGR